MLLLKLLVRKRLDMKDRGLLFAFISAVLIATSLIWSRLILGSTNPETGALIYFGTGALLSVIFLFVTGDIKKLKIFVRYKNIIIIFGIIHGISALLFFYSVSVIGPSLTGFLLKLETLLSVIFGVLLLKERLTKFETAGAAVAILGAFLIFFRFDMTLAIGAIYAVMLATFVGITNLISKKYIKQIEPMAMNAFRMIFIVVTLLPYALLTGSLQIPNSNVLLYSTVGAFISAVIGITFFYKALQRASLSKVMIVRTLEPLFVVIYAFFVFSELLGIMQLAGGALIVVGTSLLFVKK